MTRRTGDGPSGRSGTSTSDEWLAPVGASAAAAVKAPAELLGDYLPLLADAAINGRRPDAFELDAVRELGRRAAAQGGGARRAGGPSPSPPGGVWGGRAGAGGVPAPAEGAPGGRAGGGAGAA